MLCRLHLPSRRLTRILFSACAIGWVPGPVPRAIAQSDLLRLIRAKQVEADGTSIATLTRPDGSLAVSRIVGPDGTQIRSSFVGREVSHVITSREGRTTRVERRDGVQAVYVSEDQEPLVRGMWTARGPTPVRTRPRTAFQEPQDPLAPRYMIYADPGGPGSNPAGLGGGGLMAAVLALIELYNRQNVDPSSLGAGAQDASFIAFRAWAVDAQPADKLVPTPIMVGSLSDEQLRESCKRLAEVQEAHGPFRELPPICLSAQGNPRQRPALLQADPAPVRGSISYRLPRIVWTY